MAIVAKTAGYAVEVQALTITGLTITFNAGTHTATVGPGPTYYPVNLGESLFLSDSTSFWEVTTLRWGQGRAVLDANTGVVTLGAATGGSAGSTPIGTVLAFASGTVSDLGSGSAQVAY